MSSAPTKSRYEPDTYWEQLLSDSFDASGVAYAYLAVSFNEAMYRAERDVVRRALRQHAGSGPINAALDVGCGTGVWVDFWHQLSVSRVTGLDLTKASVSRLRKTRPADEFLQLDIGEPGMNLDQRFDAISAMSVLLHIVEPERFSAAVANLARHLAPGGVLFMIEPLVVNRWWGQEFGPTSNSRIRTVSDWADVLATHGLEIVDLRPITFLLANPIDARTPRELRLWSKYWSYILRFVGQRERVGSIAGRLLELLDRPLRRTLRPGPSAKLIVVRHRRRAG